MGQLPVQALISGPRPPGQGILGLWAPGPESKGTMPGSLSITRSLTYICQVPLSHKVPYAQVPGSGVRISLGGALFCPAQYATGGYLIAFG